MGAARGEWIEWLCPGVLRKQVAVTVDPFIDLLERQRERLTQPGDYVVAKNRCTRSHSVRIRADPQG